MVLQRVDERRARLAVREGGVTAQDFSEVGVHAQPDAAEQASHEPAGAEHALVDEQRKHELGARQAGRPQQRGDVAAQPTAAHEDQPLAVLGELVGELHGHAAAQRVPDERGSLMPERHQEITDPARVGAQRVVPAGLGRLTVAEQIGSDDGEALGQIREHVRPCGRRRRDPVDQHDHRTAARRAIEDAVPMKDDLVQPVEPRVGQARLRLPRWFGSLRGAASSRGVVRSGHRWRGAGQAERGANSRRQCAARMGTRAPPPRHESSPASARRPVRRRETRSRRPD